MNILRISGDLSQVALHRKTKTPARFSANAAAVLGGDSVHFGSDNTALAVSDQLSRALNLMTTVLDRSRGSEFTSNSNQHVIHISRDPKKGTLRFRMSAAVMPGETGNTRQRIVLTYHNENGTWRLVPDQSGGYQNLTQEGIAGLLSSTSVLENITLTEQNTAATHQAEMDAVAREIAIPLARLVKQFPLKRGSKTTQFPVQGYTDRTIHTQIIFKGDTYEVLMGPVTASGLKPFVRFEFDGRGAIVKNSLDTEEAALLKGNLANVSNALVNLLLNTIAKDKTVTPLIINLLRHAASNEQETINVPGGSIRIRPGEISLKNDQEWYVQWTVPLGSKNPPNVAVATPHSLGSAEVENIDVAKVVSMLQNAHVLSQGGFNALAKGLYGDFVRVSRPNGELNPFFDPVEQLLGWHVDKHKVIVFGDLDDMLGNENLPSGLKAFAAKHGLLSPNTAKERYGPGIPWREAIVLGWYDDRNPRRGAAILLVMDRNGRVPSEAKMVVLPMDPNQFNQKEFDSVVSSSNMRAIAEAVRYPISPVDELIEGEIIQADSPAMLATTLADSAQQLIVEIPQYFEMANGRLAHLATQHGHLTTGVNAMVQGSLSQVDAKQAELRRQYLEQARRERVARRATNTMIRVSAQQLEAQNLQMELRSKETDRIKAMVGDVLRQILDEISIRTSWSFGEAQKTEAARRKQEVLQTHQALKKGFNRGQAEIDAIDGALRDIKAAMDRITAITAEMSATENRIYALTNSGPNMVASHRPDETGYGPFQFDERVDELRRLTLKQVQDYHTVVTLQNTIINMSVSIMRHEDETRKLLRQGISGRERLVTGGTGSNLALAARSEVRGGNMPQIAAPSPLMADKLRALKNSGNPQEELPPLETGKAPRQLTGGQPTEYPATELAEYGDEDQ